MLVYFVRHQAGGVQWDSPFIMEPSAEQVAAISDRCVALHGTSHPKSGEPYWLSVIAVEVLNEHDLPRAVGPGGASLPPGVASIVPEGPRGSGEAFVRQPGVI